MTVRPWRIKTSADDLVEGLFGQVLLWTFELLPWLDARGMRPAWDIRSRLYGDSPDCRVLPGVFDLAYPDPSEGGRDCRDVAMLALRVGSVSMLGNDWPALHQLWHRFFQVPARTRAQADAVALPPGRCLGLHYRGTDKNLALQDTNPVAIEDMLDLAADFLRGRPAIDTVFVATDEQAFAMAARARFATLQVIHLGEVAFHKAEGGGAARADRALLDCLLLSRCTHVLKCSSALSGFAKVLNPDLDIWRIAACKQFKDVPYFPDAYIPRLQSAEPRLQAVLARQFEGDWLDMPGRASVPTAPFLSRPRYRPAQQAMNAAKYIVSVLLGRPRKA